MAKLKYPKKPQAPKQSAPLATHERYHARIADWQKKCKEIDRINGEQIKAAEKTAKLKGLGYVPGKTASRRR